ncbi:hypothetical protein GCM10010145_03950 [Streptomyces ruber]|uniref:Uncharacterized protein n=2 Tax=Streptomyces TaxID=1883 RepID=A0A918EMZ6_9ACTN|nr:hypothetical protein [Streptomyces ruber]GGQ39483.1 hypothetical protein GCM10010145_03950 [Streptomyces ruber]
MQASEHAPERDEALPRTPPATKAPGTAGVPMRDLLASCAAARVISTPPSAPAAAYPARGERRHPEAA